MVVLTTSREELGPEVEMVGLEMGLEEQVARITARHAGDQSTIDMMKVGKKNRHKTHSEV